MSSTNPQLLTETPRGLYCPAGDFYIDPWRPVSKAIVTHAHSDHARPGSKHYLAASAGAAILRMRLGKQEDIEFLDYGQSITLGNVSISLHPAGHMTGAAQVRLELDGEVAVVSGDYKRQSDPTCADFEVLKCHTFVTESTFGLPIYSWPDPLIVFDEINHWWKSNRQAGRASVLLGYSVGKAQRLLTGVDAEIGPIVGHGAIMSACAAYQDCGVKLPSIVPVSDYDTRVPWSEALIIAPPSAHGTTWLRRFGNVSVAMASGWMQVRGIRRRRSVDRGFVVSDHVDWQDLMRTIDDCECENAWVTHGYTEQVVRSLTAKGISARVVKTKFGEEEENEGSPSAGLAENVSKSEDVPDNSPRSDLET